MQLEELKIWLADYIKGFLSENPEYNAIIKMKEGHTKRVCHEIVALGRSLNLNRAFIYLAETAALLHDVGRFEQYTRYGTFVDKRSVDHAALGIRVITGAGLLEALNDCERSLVLQAIECHNKASVPSGIKGKHRFMAKMLRDADKIDIWRVVTEYYKRNETVRNRSIELDLPDIPAVSGSVMAAIKAGKTVRNDDMKSLNDFKALQMNWVFDLNFPYTLKAVRELEYLEKLREVITDGRSAGEIYRIVTQYLDRHAA